jgi:RNA polymerase sigma factor (sigma-70 family)
MLTDSDLLRRYVDDADQPSFAELVERHLRIVFNAALRRVNGNRALAEEATQLVFSQLAAKTPRLVNHPSLLAWLYTSTRYAATVLIRREQRIAARQHSAAAMPIQDNDGPNWETLRPFIDESIDRLSRQHRQAVLLRYFAGKSYAEIGAEMHLSENAARKCVDRAIEKLRRQFAGRGITTSASAFGLALSVATVNAATPPLAATIAATATASAGAAHGTLVGTLISFMTASKLSSTAAVILALIAMSGFGTGVILWSQAQDRERQQLDALNAQALALHARLQGRARTPKRADRAATAAAASDQTSAKDDFMQKQYRLTYVLATDPAYAPIREQEYRLKFLHEYGAFITSRHLSPEKVEALRRSLTSYYQAIRVHTAEMLIDPGKMKAVRGVLAADEKALFESLSPAFPADEQADIRRCFAAQQMVPTARAIGQVLEFSGAPLDRVQELALAMITSETAAQSKSAPPERQKQFDEVDPVTGLSPQDRNLLDDAAAFMSEEQLKQYENYLRVDHARYVALQRARELYEQSHPGT